MDEKIRHALPEVTSTDKIIFKIKMKNNFFSDNIFIVPIICLLIF